MRRCSASTSSAATTTRSFASNRPTSPTTTSLPSTRSSPMTSSTDFPLPPVSDSSPQPQPMTQSQPSTPEKPQDIVLADGQGVFYGIPADQYHGSSFTNRSKLDDFHESRELYHENYVLGKREDEEKEAYKIGRA